jgi:hypothetical protein
MSGKLANLLAKAGKDESLRNELLHKSKEWWIGLMSPDVQDNIEGTYEAEFMIWEYLKYLLGCILSTSPMRSLDSPPKQFMEALHSSIQVMFKSTKIFDVAEKELDVLMSLLDLSVHKRAVVLCEHILNGRVKFVYRRHQVILALAQHPDKTISYEYLGKLSALCRTEYKFYLDKIMLCQYPYQSLDGELETIKHIIKGYSKGQPLAQFVVELYSGGEDLLETKYEEPTDLEYAFLRLNLFPILTGALIDEHVHLAERVKLLKTFSSLLKEGFLDEQDFFGVPVRIYGTDNVECHRWFGEHFGGYKRFYELWVESAGRNANKEYVETEYMLPPFRFTL